MSHLNVVGEIVVSENRIEWTIHQYNSYEWSYKDDIYSKEIRFKDDLCKMMLYVMDTMEITLIPLSNRNKWSEYKVHLSIRKRSGEQTERKCLKYLETGGFQFTRLVDWVTLCDNRDELSPDGNLTIICSLEKEGDLKSQLDAVAFRDKFETMYQTGEFCDFKVKVQNRVFRTHRVVLAARSSVFASMLHHDMKEKKTGMLEIADCDSNTFETFLKFLYSGKSDGITGGNVVSLYKVANKYDVQNLKAECRCFMMKNLSTDFFCNLICLAKKHDDKELFKQATEYFKRNKKNIFLSLEWENFLKENYAYAKELLIHLCD